MITISVLLFNVRLLVISISLSSFSFYVFMYSSTNHEHSYVEILKSVDFMTLPVRFRKLK